MHCQPAHRLGVGLGVLMLKPASHQQDKAIKRARGGEAVGEIARTFDVHHSTCSKTSTVMLLSANLAAQGYRVAVIDADRNQSFASWHALTGCSASRHRRAGTLPVVSGPKGVFASVTRGRAREALSDAQQRLRRNAESCQRAPAARLP